MKKDWNQNANYGIGELRASYGSDYKKKTKRFKSFSEKLIVTSLTL